MNITAVNTLAPSSWNCCICAPFLYIASKVRGVAESVFGYLLRIVTFQLGEINAQGAYSVMRFYQYFFSCDPKEEKPFDQERLNRSKQFLLNYGGTEHFVQSQDGERIHCITFKSSEFYESFARQNSRPIDIVYEGRQRQALLNPPLDAALKFYFPIVNITLLDGTVQPGALLPERCPSANPPHILHCHSPGRSACMDRKLVGLYLAAGYDLTIWDPRGTIESTGTPSEGGYYLDADAVLQKVCQTTPIHRIYLSGFCEGAAIAAYLKKRYHAQGIHLIASNPYTSMKEVVESYGWLGRMAAHYGLKATQDPNIPVPQDGFDNVKKLRNLARSEGKLILIHTDTDQMMPRGTASKMIAAFDQAGPSHEILRIHPNPKENGHLEPPYQDPLVWRRLVKVVI